MCAPNHLFATTTQFSFRRTRFEVEYSCSRLFLRSSVLQSHFFRIFPMSHRRFSLFLSLSILFLHSLLRILSSFRRSKSKSMHASLASRHSCPYVEINCPVIIALAVSVRSLSISSQPWLDAKSNRRHTSSNHARFISVFTGLRLVAKSLLHLHGAYRIVCLGKLKREKFAKDRVSKKRLRFVKNNQSTRAFRISLVCQIRSNYRNSMQRDNTPHGIFGKIDIDISLLA